MAYYTENQAWLLKLRLLFFHSSELTQPPQVRVDGTTWGVLAAIAVILLCIGITIIAFVYLKRRKQHAKKMDLRRFAVKFVHAPNSEHQSIPIL